MTTQAPRPRPASQVTVLSPAKVNVYLRIVGRRDDGYHDLETVMLPLDFGDQITLQLRKASTVLECDNPNLAVDDSNLALRAAKLLAESCSEEKGVKVLLRKRIPLAAGLGGGSSNAAAVLLGLNRLWAANATPGRLGELGAALGSDVNFFLANSAAVCRGRGELVEPVPCKLSATVLLVNPGFGIPTPWAYQSYARIADDGRLTDVVPDASLLLRALAEDDGETVGRTLFNALESPAVRKFPVLQLLKEMLKAQGALGSLMSGSGATVFGLFQDARVAEAAGRQVRSEFGPGTWTQVAKIAASA